MMTSAQDVETSFNVANSLDVQTKRKNNNFQAILLLFYFVQERQQKVENFAPIKSYISECLDKLQNAMKGTNNVTV